MPRRFETILSDVFVYGWEYRRTLASRPFRFDVLASTVRRGKQRKIRFSIAASVPLSQAFGIPEKVATSESLHSS